MWRSPSTAVHLRFQSFQLDKRIEMSNSRISSAVDGKRRRLHTYVFWRGLLCGVQLCHECFYLPLCCRVYFSLLQCLVVACSHAMSLYLPVSCSVCCSVLPCLLQRVAVCCSVFENTATLFSYEKTLDLFFSFTLAYWRAVIQWAGL